MRLSEDPSVRVLLLMEESYTSHAAGCWEARLLLTVWYLYAGTPRTMSAGRNKTRRVGVMTRFYLFEIHMQYDCPANLSRDSLLKKRNLVRGVIEWLLFRRGPAAIPHSRVGGFLRSDSTVQHPDIQYHFWPFFLEGWSIPAPAHRDGLNSSQMILLQQFPVKLR